VYNGYLRNRLHLEIHRAYIGIMPKVGPYSRAAILQKPDGRTREARLVASLRAELIAHLGGSPSVAQRMMIDQACELQLRIAIMNRKFMQTAEFTEHDSRTFLAWNNSLTRLLARIGLKGIRPPQPTLVEMMRAPKLAA
jgi:hypothetical protein